MENDPEELTVEELFLQVRQLEDTAREAHIHLRDEIAEQEETITVQEERIDELEEELADAKRELRRLEQQLVVLQEKHGTDEQTDDGRELCKHAARARFATGE